MEEAVLIDFDAENKLIGIEILDVTNRFDLADIANLHVENMPIEVVS